MVVWWRRMEEARGKTCMKASLLGGDQLLYQDITTCTRAREW